MNYVGPLSSSIYIEIAYQYILVFVDRLTKIRYMILTITMEPEKTA